MLRNEHLLQKRQSIKQHSEKRMVYIFRDVLLSTTRRPRLLRTFGLKVTRHNHGLMGTLQWPLQWPGFPDQQSESLFCQTQLVISFLVLAKLMTRSLLSDGTRGLDIRKNCKLFTTLRVE